MADSLISEDLKIEGDIDAGGGKVIVVGQVTGDIKAGAVEVQGKGMVTGAINADNVLVQGSQSGRITCSELTLSSTSDVKSDVKARSMVSEKGARLRGKVEITGS